MDETAGANIPVSTGEQPALIKAGCFPLKGEIVKMALLVWLPFIGDTRNNGIESVVSVTGTPTWSNTGKIGKCKAGGDLVYTFQNDFISAITTSAKYTFMAWIKQSTIGGWTVRIGGTGTAQSRGFYTGGTSSQLHWAYQGSGVNIDLNVEYKNNVWHHVAAVSNGRNVKVYIDGELAGQTNSASTTAITGFKTIYFYQLSDYQINDFRLYDECLSAKEIKLISQALMAHYTFNDCCESTVNYFQPASSVGLSSNVSSSDWRLERPDINTFKITALVNNPSYGTYGNIVEGLGTGVSAAANQSMTQSCEIVDFKGSLSRIYPGSGGFGSIVGYGEYKGRIYRTITHNQAWGHNFVIRTSSQSAIKAGDYLIIRNLQIELKNHPTDFVNGTRNSNAFYDTSGYMNNGVITGNFQTDYISPRYQIANIFDTSTAINIESQFATAGTIAMWVKPTVKSGIFFIDGSSGTALACGFYQFDKLIISRETKNMYNSSIIPLNQWTHFCIVNEGNPFKIYINGQLSTSILDTTQSWSPSVTNFAIGHRNGGDHFQGSMSDFRIYATVLSAADVKELYETSMIVDSNGNILPRILST